MLFVVLNSFSSFSFLCPHFKWKSFSFLGVFMPAPSVNGANTVQVPDFCLYTFRADGNLTISIIFCWPPCCWLHFLACDILVQHYLGHGVSFGNHLSKWRIPVQAQKQLSHAGGITQVPRVFSFCQISSHWECFFLLLNYYNKSHRF